MWPFTVVSPPPPDYTILILCSIIYCLLCKLYIMKPERSKKPKDLPDLDQVIGLQSVKEEVRQYMKLIKNNFTYLTWKVQLPKGILLIGPPGTGKTLLVKALAKELKIPVVTAVGSDFVEKYVGVGASRVRKLFAKARKHKECVVFIDEIDAVGSVRDIGGNSERAGTLNQLLVEMDGFNSDSRIIVFAATNIAKCLDPALLRSGRFDKKVYFDLPNKKEREQMFDLYVGKIKISDASSKSLAKRTPGLSGADIANVVNQAKLNAMHNENLVITAQDMDSAIDEVMIGREKRERSLSPKELKRVAHHEAGHALVACLIAGACKPLKVSIIPRGEMALGFSQDQPRDKKLLVQIDILSKIAVLFGGRAAEKIIYDDFSTGARDDIEKATVLLDSYVTKWGMADTYGPLNPKYLSTREDKSSLVLIKKITFSIETFVTDIVRRNQKYVRKIAKLLIERETIFYEDLTNIISNKKLNSISLDDLCDM